MTRPSLHVQMLGGFSLQLGDEPMASIPARPASLLAYLIVNRDRDHTRDLLAGRFWSDLSDDVARRRLSQALWEISSRTKDVAPLLANTTNTVRFNPDLEVTVDAEIFERRLDDFERQLRTNRHEVRVSDLSAIVDSYRGELLAGYYDEWLGDEREKLRSRYRAALGQLVQLTSNEGDYETALRYAQLLVGEEPLDEVAQREVLRLYALNGQPSAAERHFQRFKKELATQVGAEPSAETSSLMRRISDDAATPPTGFSDTERQATELVGRRAERSAVLNRVIELTSSAKGGLVLIEGDAGVGKTRLAEEMAQGAEWRGANVLVGRHNDTSALNPYEGLKEALASVAVGLRGERLKDSVESLWLQQASGVLDGLAALVGGTERPRLRPEEEPWRTTEALARIILAQGRPKPTVLILEDIHLCDEDTMAVLAQLGDRLIDSEVLVCLTYQLAAARAKEVIWDGLSQLEAEPGSSRVVVPSLQPEESRELITAELGPGRVSAAMVDQLITSTGGNPYMLLELLRNPGELLDDETPTARPRDLDGSEPTRIDDHLLPKLADLIGKRMESSPERVQQVLEAVAAVGGPASPTVVARAADIEHAEAIDGLQRAVDLGFLVETERGCDFGQSQTRRVVYDGLPIDRRKVLHGRIVDALTLLDAGVSVGQIAHHAWQAGQWQRAYQYHSLAADGALKVNAYQTSAEHLTKADDAARSAGIDDGARLDDHFDFEEVLDILGRREDQARLLDRLATSADLPLEVDVRLQHRRAWLLLHTDRPAAAAELASAAAARAHDNGINSGELLTTVGVALLRSGQPAASLEPLAEAIVELETGRLSAVQAKLQLGRAHADLRNTDDARRYLEDAYDEAKAAADARSQVEALGHLGAMWFAEAVDDRIEQAFSEAVELAGEIGYRLGEGQNLVNLSVFHIDRGRAGRALGLLDAAGDVFASLRNRRGGAFVKMNRAWLLHWYVGDDETAERVATEAAVQFREFGDAWNETICQNVIAAIELRTGRRRRARKRLTNALEVATGGDNPRSQIRLLIYLALVDLDLGQPDEALERVATAQAICESSNLDLFVAVLTAIEASARVAIGDVRAAVDLTETIVRANHPGAELAHLAAWWCAEVFMAGDEHQAAADQVAFAHELLTRNLDGLPDALVAGAWTGIPEHRAIVDAREHYFVDRAVLEVPRLDVPTGRPLVDEDYVSATVTKSHPDDWRSPSAVERRRRRLLRIAGEAAEQGGAARLSDLADVLSVSERTVKRDLAALREAGHDVVSRRGHEENS